MHGQANGKHWLERWARRTPPDFVLANSQFTVASLPNIYPDVPSTVVYCPVAPAEAGFDKDSRSKLRAELNTPEDATVIIQVSRMETGKGHELHFQALNLLRDLPGWSCWLVGGAQNQNEQKYFAELKNAAASLGISERVRFLGQRSDVPQLLRSADIFCQPNTSPDSFGIVFVEALYAQLPVVTTDMGAVRELLDGSCGVIVPPANAGALADSLRRLLTNSAERVRLGTAGPLRAKQLCDPAANLKVLEESIRSRTNFAHD
jgi:glycosyltransferase involved in cell wall biosynthesis